MSKCQKIGCHQDAAGKIGIMVPGIGGSTEPVSCINVYINLSLCQAHFDEAAQKPADWLSRPLRNAVKAMTRGKASPDFERAYLQLKPFEEAGEA